MMKGIIFINLINIDHTAPYYFLVRKVSIMDINPNELVVDVRLYNMVDGIIDCSNMGLTSLSFMEKHPRFNEILEINCCNNKLKKLPLWPNVIKVNCSFNQLKELPSQGPLGWPNVGNVTCYCNELKELPLWPNVTSVNCYRNKLRKLPLWPNVIEVYCDDNQLEELPLWPNVTRVNCCNNQLIELPSWPNVKIIHCIMNQLTELPLWLSVNVVNCEKNQLTKLPLWRNVTSVTCDIEQLIYIPYWPKLKFIDTNGPRLYGIGNLSPKYIAKRKFFNTLCLINNENKKIKMSMRIHELKWRKVNSEIICRPETGIEWLKYKEIINNL